MAASGGLAQLSNGPDVCWRIKEERQGLQIMKELLVGARVSAAGPAAPFASSSRPARQSPAIRVYGWVWQATL